MTPAEMQGRAAWDAGLRPEAAPYNFPSPEHEMWIFGYASAAHEGRCESERYLRDLAAEGL